MLTESLCTGSAPADGDSVRGVSSNEQKRVWLRRWDGGYSSSHPILGQFDMWVRYKPPHHPSPLVSPNDLQLFSRQQNAIPSPALANEICCPRKQLLGTHPIPTLFPSGTLASARESSTRFGVNNFNQPARI